MGMKVHSDNRDLIGCRRSLFFILFGTLTAFAAIGALSLLAPRVLIELALYATERSISDASISDPNDLASQDDAILSMDVDADQMEETENNPTVTRPSATLTTRPSRTQDQLTQISNTRTGTPSFTPSPTPTLQPTATMTLKATLTFTVTRIPTRTSRPSSTLTLTQIPTHTVPPTRTSTVIVLSPTTTIEIPTKTPSPIGFCDATGNSGFESTLVNLINEERENQDLDPLTLRTLLTAAARTHSTDMACNDFLSHTGSDGSSPADRVAAQGYSYSAVGENIYAGGGSYNSPQQAFQFWMNSSLHRANLLNTNYQSIGIGYMYSADSQYGGYFTAVFARP